MVKSSALAIALVLVACSGAAGVRAMQPEDETFEFAKLSLRIEEIRKDCRSPGMAVAIVRGERVIWAHGFGNRQAGTPTPVDEHTVFAIGSATKPFTAAALAILVQAKKLEWNDRVRDRLPGFTVADAVATSEIRLRDLLCHNTGVDRADLLWYGSGFDRRSLLRRLSRVKSIAPIRSVFQYNNLMYMVAGLVIEQTSGASWDEFVRTRLFVPLGMQDSSTSLVDRPKNGNIAMPHALIDDSIVEVEPRDLDNVGPAGSINSSLADMTRWMAALLSALNGKEGRTLPANAMRDLFAPRVAIANPGPPLQFGDVTQFVNYGLGWFIADYRGRRLVFHPGGIDGMSASVAMLPDEDLGVIVLSNLDSNFAVIAVRNEILDAALGVDGFDWHRQVGMELAPMLNFVREYKIPEKLPDSPKGMSSLKPESICGTYEHPTFGPFVISQESGDLRLRLPRRRLGRRRHPRLPG